MLLAGKVAVVTGAGRGIGRAIARRLASEGASLALAARTAAELESARAELARDFPSVACIAVPTDVTDEAAVRHLVERARSELGRLDALVNNAGTPGPIGELEPCDLDAWRRTFEVNLLGTVHGIRAALPLLRAQGGGKIVNLSGAGLGGSATVPRMHAYLASKAAIVALTESAARELAPWNIQVNAISPGGINTALTDAIIAAGPERAGPDFHARNVRQRAQGGEPPERAAALVVWLASPRSGALTGKLLSAKWDDPDAIDPEAANRSSLYTMRRIDGSLVREVPRS